MLQLHSAENKLAPRFKPVHIVADTAARDHELEIRDA
jgi:hypothetical protein